MSRSSLVTLNRSASHSRRDLSIWDAVAQGWRKPTGTIEFSVGANNRDLKLEGTVSE